MKKRLLTLIMGLTLASMSIGASAEESEIAQENPTTYGAATFLNGINAENYPLVDGSTATLPLSQAVYRLATGSSLAEADEAIVHTKTTNSYLRLINGEVDLLIVADKNENVDEALAESGVEIEQKPIALDAFVFLANESNPVTNLSTEEIQKIYTGEITNWSELGGNDSEIIPFQRNENAGSQTAMKNIVMNGIEMIAPEKLEIPTMDGLLEAIAAYNNEANALGYSYYYYANLMYQTPGLRFMAVDGVEPNSENVQNRSYPYIATYYAVVRKDEAADSSARKIFDFLTTGEGQELAASLGYIPVSTGIEISELYTEELSEKLPIADNERLIVRPTTFTNLIIDNNGKVLERIENGYIETSSEWYETELAAIVSADEPLIVAVKTGLDEWDYRYGLYDVGTCEWIVEPVYSELRDLGNGLYTDTGIDSGWGGSLMRGDGSIAAETDDMWISWLDGTYITDGTQIYDSQNDTIYPIEGYVREVTDKYILVDAQEGTKLYDLNGNIIWIEQSGLTVYKIFDEWISWYDQNGTGLITDMNLQPVISEAQFLQINADRQITGDYFYLQAQSADESRKIVGLRDFDEELGYYRDFYYLCDQEYRVIEGLDNIYFNENSGQYFTFVNAGEYVQVRNLFTDSIKEIDIQMDGKIQYAGITDIGPIEFVRVFGQNYDSYSVACQNGVLMEDMPKDFYLFQRDDGIIECVEELDDGTMWRIYYDSEGNYIAGKEEQIEYANENLRCIQHGSYLYIEDTNGNLYLRLLISDENAVEETEIYY